MRRRLVGAGLAVVLLAGCGGDGDGGAAAPSVTTTSASPTPSEVTEAQLEAALVAQGDLPAGWNVEPPDPDDDDSMGGEECQEFERLEKALDDAPNAEVSFSKADLGPFFSEAIGAAPSEAEAAALLQEYGTVLSACPSFTITDDEGTKSQVRITSLTFPSIGDGTAAFRMTMSFQGGTYTLDTVIVRIRRYLALFVGTSIKTRVGGGSISIADFEALVGKAVAKARDTLP